ncbi:MAG: methionine--tRNA ligase [Parcubacteria group bacterium]|nr:methionine--tRNA ligase [Parcubacteria group bacterium]MCR4342483.1 methionine--tRNA ligase [Patescibacteria group bacterium]
MEKGKFYITTTLPYVNADPHLGHALELVEADIVARFHRGLGEEVFFNTGTDEHGLKVYRKAQEKGEIVQNYCDSCAENFRKLQPALNLTSDAFIRTTDSHHKEAAQEFWRRSFDAGDIYKKNYKIKYCVGCELEKTDSDLKDGKCLDHPNLEIEVIEEENYFFRFSKYQDRLIDFYEKNSFFVLPEKRFNEAKKFVESGISDFSISRLKEKMPWGVPVPNDQDHVMYVWFDALVNYISTLGWPEDEKKFHAFWPGVQLAGKDNLRQQAVMWQAMLMSVGLPNTTQVVIHGFITSNGQKMSKTLGNVINPFDIVERYGTDALRYYLAREVSPFEDSDFTEEKFKEAYNANLANGLGNLVSRTMKMFVAYDVYNYGFEFNFSPFEEMVKSESYRDYREFIATFEFGKVMDFIWERIGGIDKRIQETQPFKFIKTDKEKAIDDVAGLVNELWGIANLLAPFMPETSQKIKEAIKANKMPEPLFLRKE